MVPASRRLLCLAVLLLPATSAAQLNPRVALDTGPVRAAPLPPGADAPLASGWEHRLVVKFADEVRARATPAGGLLSRTGVDLTEVETLAAAEGLAFFKIMGASEDRLADLQSRGEARSGVAQPDLAGILGVAVPSADVARLQAVGQSLQDSALVEFAHIQTLGLPPPADIAPTTPDLTGNQGYFPTDPGLDVDYAWSQGLRGAGIAIRDCEYGWNAAHEDLVDVSLNPEPGQTVDPSVASLGWDEHGTAVLGEMIGVENAYGVTGIAPEATAYTYTEWSVEEGIRRVAAISSAVTDAVAGDVVLLEMQANGAGGGFGPAELDPVVHNLCSAATAAGVVVVGAAGNGNQDLDGAAYAPYMSWADSGAIIVGAGSSDTDHDKLSFSTYGTRVDVQGWGEDVFTLGYGAFAQYGGDKDQRYTDSFNGTSSASPFIAAVCALMQQRAIELFGEPLEPAVLRQVLVDTGIPQGSGGNIGPFPDLEAALLALPGLELDPWEDLRNGLAGQTGVPVQVAMGTLLPGTAFGFEVTNARPLAQAYQILGLSELSLPFKGGILVPKLDLLIGPVLVSLAGTVGYTSTWPVGIPAGAPTWWQWWIVDTAGPAGFSATNGVKGTAQQ